MSATGKTEPTLEGFRDFCASKSADEVYVYIDSHVCPCGQYSETLGMEVSHYTMPAWRRAYYADDPVWVALDDAASELPFTWGALTARLRSQVAK